MCAKVTSEGFVDGSSRRAMTADDFIWRRCPDGNDRLIVRHLNSPHFRNIGQMLPKHLGDETEYLPRGHEFKPLPGAQAPPPRQPVIGGTMIDGRLASERDH